MSTRIISLSTTGGFLEGSFIQFAEGLTCIIGARGTCKSTVVETIRFAFDCNPERVKLLLEKPSAHDSPSNQGLIRATLQQGTARCIVSETVIDGTSEVTIERDVDSSSRVYREGVKELSDQSILHCLEIYSQGDLQDIAEKDELRLELIDRPNKTIIARPIEQRLQAAERLKRLGLDLRKQRAQIETLRAEIRGLDVLRTQMDELHAQRPNISQELDAEREAFLQRKSAIDQLRTALNTREEIIRNLLDALGNRLDLSMVSHLRQLNVKEAELLYTELESFTDLLSQLRNDFEASQAKDFNPHLASLEKRIEELNTTYYRLRQEQQDVNDSLKREDNLKQQIQHLEKRVKEMENAQEIEQKFLKERNECRHIIREVSDRIYRLRLQQVDQINNDHSDVVMLTLAQGSRSSDYAKKLSELLQGSRLRNQEEVARDLADRVRPSDLIDIVEAGDSQRLSTLLARDLGQMARLVSYLMDSNGLYDLEGIIFEDQLDITMYDGDVPKPVSQLSRGQMATALLPLVLRSAEYPLIFDQPEDDLDNRFIYTELVTRIRKLKQERQVIFVTHNANIPVLGEADKVVVMQMDNPKHAKPPLIGPVDSPDIKQHILTLLEGGAEAFKRRGEQYGDLII